MRVIVLIFFLYGCSVIAAGRTFVSTMGDMKAEVRVETGQHDTSHLPDSTLEGFCSRALLYTSVDIGGKEGQLRVVTIAEQGFYSIPDSIAKVVHVTLVSNNKTYTLKSWYPELILDKWPDDEGREYISPGPADETPFAYNYWADTLQLIPVPQKVDSIYLKVYLEYASDTVDGNAVQLRPAYVEAAIAYASHLVWKKSDQSKKAEVYLTRYKELKIELKTVYTRRLDNVR